MSDKSRRKLLKSIAASSGAVIAGKSLPESWARPVVDSVMLPSHAQTSGIAGSYTTQTSYQPMQGLNSDGDSMFTRVIDSMVPSANAQIDLPAPIITDWCVDVTEDGMWSAAIRSSQEGSLHGLWTVEGGTVGGPGMDMTEVSFCVENGMHPVINFQVTIATQANVQVVIYEGMYLNALDLIPAGTCPFTDLTEECIMLSDRAVKSDFAPVDEQEILRKVASLPIETWNYTDRDQGVRHIGPMAQDFMASFGVGDSDRHIHMVDANGVNLAAIKALNTKLEEKDTQIRNLQEQLATVMKRLDRLA